MKHWITRFGVPSCVITDRGTPFISELFRNLASLCRVKVTHTTSYHPQSNGKIERLHCTLKTAIRCHNSLHWTETLPTVLIGLRAALHEECKYTIAEMVYGKTIKLPGEFIEESNMPISNDNFVSNLRNQMALLKPYQSKFKCKQKICTHARMCSCGLTELKPAYVLRPNELLSPTSKSDHISVPRTQTSVPSQQIEQPKKSTRCGRQVKFPVRFNDVIDSS
ncbi:uncharacterized protein LOC118193340 [Stegodyphus dumicola]|uniref:uncharacterized protein LOC118193340 n=1 Tax=Stegodyphus dumicola TaxID=202533 RepID=UPI0015A91E91|nr:uncharacterized protein LOC118193340 [Stegodyphus dumicola]